MGSASCSLPVKCFENQRCSALVVRRWRFWSPELQLGVLLALTKDFRMNVHVDLGQVAGMVLCNLSIDYN